ncbi:hypothetical protein K432DRAFT_448010 [Lepidopterella palustris CBS 459.81]|uniref:F-box domain-containing protein n=1 Tax=Lepidopterella palustris CBS 459.81 TaxID=1314670 RepID=A0A8E2DWE6_9PEZI|nr:hypothetical protein K432DRAFT_448010 [Lepidopterella palustris CBS 459.81]
MEPCFSLQDLHALAGSCKHFRNIFLNTPCHYYNLVLRRTLPAFDDALRAQRASVSAMLHLKNLGYYDYCDDDDFNSILPPAGMALGPIPAVCRFDLDEGEYVNVPTEDDIIKLGETPIASVWEAQRVMQLHKIISSCRRSVGSHPQLNVWFEGVNNWTFDQEERFFRGAYRYWLYGYLFFPGCYLEPFFVEKERILATVPQEFTDSEGYFSFADDRYYTLMEQYPLFIPVIDSDIREERLEFLFDGFIAWLMHNGEQRGVREHARGISAPPSTPYHKGTVYRHVYPPDAHGGMREFLLMHTMMTFLRDISSGPERKLEDETSAVRFPVFDDRRHLCIRIWQTRKNGETPELETYTVRRPPQIADPLGLLRAFRFRNGDSSIHSPIGWPAIEAVVVGLLKYYQVELSEKIAGWCRADYECDGGAVLDLPGADDPFEEIEAKD